MKAYVAGLVNIETNVAVKEFPVPYFPIDYSFFGVQTSVGGVGYNVSKALTVLGDEVKYITLTGDDINAGTIEQQLSMDGIAIDGIKKTIKATPQSVVLYAPDGRREVYCDLKDIQDNTYEVEDESQIENSDVCVICNINFNRPLLKKAKSMGKLIATDVHVLSDINDEYNKDFMENADILFLSDEAVKGKEHEMIRELADSYSAKVIVMGRGASGVSFYDRSVDMITDLPAYEAKSVVNTVGAGDALFSAFVHFYVKGDGIKEALVKAQIFAGVKIGSNGAANGFVTEKEVMDIYQ